MDDLVTVYFQGYQEAVDPEADNYNAEIRAFLTSNGIEKYAKELYIPDGDRDGYTMVAKLVLPKVMAATLGRGVSTECPCDPDEHNYL